MKLYKLFLYPEIRSDGIDVPNLFDRQLTRDEVIKFCIGNGYAETEEDFLNRYERYGNWKIKEQEISKIPA